MIKTAAAYRAFGFRIQSAFPLPELPADSMEEGAEKVVVEVSDLSGIWEGYAEQKGKYVVDPAFVMFHVPNAATFRVEGGNKVIVSPDNGADEDKIRLFLLGTCMGIILMQRKVLPLHGSSVAVDGKAYAIVGESGAGKSTLASELTGRGYPLISDDVIAVTFSRQLTPFALPAYPQQKLWQESLDHFGMESSRFRPIFERETKFAVPVTSGFSSSPLPLAAVFELVKSKEPQIEIRRLNRLESLSALYFHTYRNFMLQRLGLMAWHFETTSQLARRIGFLRIHRPASGFTAPDLASLILTTIRNDGLERRINE